MNITDEDRFNSLALILIVSAWPVLTGEQREAMYTQVVEYTRPIHPLGDATQLRVVAARYGIARTPKAGVLRSVKGGAR